MYSELCTVYSVQYIMYSVQCIVYIVQCSFIGVGRSDCEALITVQLGFGREEVLMTGNCTVLHCDGQY